MTSRELQPAEHSAAKWSLAYWALACNQLVVIAMLTLFASEFVRKSRDTCEEQNIALPVMSQTYLSTIGPSGVMALGGVAALIILAMSLFRARFVSILVSSVAFVAIIVFLVFAFVWSYLPLWAGSVRNVTN